MSLSDPSDASTDNILHISISGPSSSGKTTLTTLLASILQPSIPTRILHQDDYYYPESQIPKDIDTGLLDWDCAGSIDFSALSANLQASKQGREQVGVESIQDRNDKTESGVRPEEVERWRAFVRRQLQSIDEGRGRSAPSWILLVDGFLLYPPQLAELDGVRDLLDLKLFLPAAYADVKSRRQGRSGYATIEGWWEDPPKYVEKIVWRGYVRDHGYLFEVSKGNGVGDDEEKRMRQTRANIDEGVVRDDVLEKYGIWALPVDSRAHMSKCLAWAMTVLASRLQWENPDLDQIMGD